jgi:hypothetical protein
MLRPVKILRIDPMRRTIAAMTLKPANDATPQVRRILRANIVAAREIMTVDFVPLMAICAADVDEAVAMWRLRGTEDNAGVGILVGRNPINGKLVDVPATSAWARDRIQWLEGEDVGSREERASELLPALNDDIRRAITAAIVTPNGDLWISADDKALVGEAMQTLGLGTERSGGQMLTRLGETIHDKLVEKN